MRVKFWKEQTKQDILDASLKKLAKEEAKANREKVKKTYTPRFYLMVLSGATTIAGVVLFVFYFKTLNVALGLPGFILAAGGLFAFMHYWKQAEGISVEYLGALAQDEIANSLCIYPDKILFENINEPEGFPMKCEGLKGNFYVNIWDKAVNKLVPFILPDQQYCDPDVFAQRVLGLPAHKKIFERKPKLLQRLKTALLVLAIGIVWLLILTTTGGD